MMQLANDNTTAIDHAWDIFAESYQSALRKCAQERGVLSENIGHIKAKMNRDPAALTITIPVTSDSDSEARNQGFLKSLRHSFARQKEFDIIPPEVQCATVGDRQLQFTAGGNRFSCIVDALSPMLRRCDAPRYPGIVAAAELSDPAQSRSR